MFRTAIRRRNWCGRPACNLDQRRNRRQRRYHHVVCRIGGDPPLFARRRARGRRLCSSLLRPAAIDPMGFKRFFERVQNEQGKPWTGVFGKIDNLLATHPGTEDRIARIEPLPKGVTSRPVMTGGPVAGAEEDLRIENFSSPFGRGRGPSALRKEGLRGINYKYCIPHPPTPQGAGPSFSYGRRGTSARRVFLPSLVPAAFHRRVRGRVPWVAAVRSAIRMRR